MKRETIENLRALNRRFYSQNAGEFSQTRNAPWPGWTRVLEPSKNAPSPLSVLDIGCGNGRFLLFLQATLASEFSYLGVDASPKLLKEAPQSAPCAKFECIDFLEPGWGENISANHFDLIAVFGVLHHIPGFENRQSFLHSLVSHLSPSGCIALTLWQFARHERFQAKVIPWEQSQENILAQDVDSGDYLLQFGQNGIRYCHFVDDEELALLVKGAGLTMSDDYLADGKTNNLNRYIIALRSGRAKL